MTSHASILLTGFGAFPGIPDNATARLVPVLAGAARTAFPDHCVHAEILKTEWADAPARVEQLLAEHRPDLALHFGVAREKLQHLLRQPPLHLIEAARIEAPGDPGCGLAANLRRGILH